LRFRTPDLAEEESLSSLKLDLHFLGQQNALICDNDFCRVFVSQPNRNNRFCGALPVAEVLFQCSALVIPARF